MAKKNLKKSKQGRGVKPGTKRGAYKKRLPEPERVDYVEATADDLSPELRDQMEESAESVPESEATPQTETPTPAQEQPPVQDKKPETIVDAEKFEEWRDEYEDITPQKEEPPATETATAAKPDADAGTRAPEERPEPEDTNAVLVNGSMLLMFCDLLFPTMIQKLYVWAGNKRAKEVRLKDVQLTDDQRESLEPLSDEVAKWLFKKLPPEVMFILALGFMYYMNFKMALDDLG